MDKEGKSIIPVDKEDLRRSKAREDREQREALEIENAELRAQRFEDQELIKRVKTENAELKAELVTTRGQLRDFALRLHSTEVGNQKLVADNKALHDAIDGYRSGLIPLQELYQKDEEHYQPKKRVYPAKRISNALRKSKLPPKVITATEVVLRYIFYARDYLSEQEGIAHMRHMREQIGKTEVTELITVYGVEVVRGVQFMDYAWLQKVARVGRKQVQWIVSGIAEMEIMLWLGYAGERLPVLYETGYWDSNPRGGDKIFRPRIARADLAKPIQGNLALAHECIKTW
jgi:hypothetical protein